MDIVEKKHEELVNLEKHMKRLDEELTNLEEKTNEIKNIKESLNDIKKVKQGTEVFFPIANGLFLKGKLESNDKLFVNVGAGAVTEKNIEETEAMIDEQEKELEKYKSDIIKNMTLVDEKAYEIEKEILKLTEDYK